MSDLSWTEQITQTNIQRAEDSETGIATEITLPMYLLETIQGQLGATWSATISAASVMGATENEKNIFHKEAQDILDLQHEINEVAGCDVM